MILIMNKNEHIKDSDFQRKHRTEWEEFLWDRFLDRVSDLKSKKQSRKVFDALFSDYERKIIVRRLAAMALIREGKGTREISRILWLSTSTVSNLKKNLLGNNEIYKSRRSSRIIRTKHNTNQPMQHSWLDDLFSVDLWELIKNPPRPSGTGLKKSMYRRVNTPVKI